MCIQVLNSVITVLTDVHYCPSTKCSLKSLCHIVTMSHSVYVTNTRDRKGNGTHNVSHCLFCHWYLFWWGLLLHIPLRYNQQCHLASVGILTDRATLSTYSYKGIGSTTLQLYPFCNNRSMCYVIVTLVSWDVVYHFERCEIHWKPEELKKKQKKNKKTCICCQHCAF